jgi:hypothetical protein
MEALKSNLEEIARKLKNKISKGKVPSKLNNKIQDNK